MVGELETFLKIVPNIGGFAAMALVLWALYQKKLVFGYQLDEADKRRMDERALLQSALKERTDECREYTVLAREALFNTRKTLEVTTKIKEGVKEGGL